jgi:exopolysaccharide biosynthesis polyprenyl glycosylphosphotransferase
MAAPPLLKARRVSSPTAKTDSPAALMRRGSLVRRALVVADVVGLVVAFMIAQVLLAPGSSAFDRLDVETETLVFLATLPGWILVAKLHGLYDHDEERTDHSTADDVVGVFHLVTVGAWIFIAGAWLTGLVSPQMTKLMTFWALGIVLVTVGRVAARAVCRSSRAYEQTTVIVGAGEVGQRVARKFRQHPEYGIDLVGFLDAEPRQLEPGLEGLSVLGPPEDLPATIDRLQVERVVIAFSRESHEETLDLIRSLKSYDVQVDIVPRLFEVVGPNLGLHTVGGLPVIGLPPLRLSRSALLLKRALDVAVSSLTLLLLAPVFGAVALAIKLESPGPVFFRQVRMGSRNRRFSMFKFRTMDDEAEERKQEIEHLNEHRDHDPRMFKAQADPRVTKVGRFLRRFSLDELPQLLNVLRGEMSLVGPRPLILDEDQHVGDWARRRLDLKPGMTGLWQVMGRSQIPFEEMVSLDFLYVTTWSFANDLRILGRTIPLVLRGDAY